MLKEIWKPVVGFENLYEVSNLGNVRSCDRFISQKSKYGKYYSLFRKGKILQPAQTRSGHLCVVLTRGHTRLIHRLVAEAFIGPRPSGMDICHNNNNPADNRVENIRYDTRGNNIRDAVKFGTWMSEKRKAHYKRLASPDRTEIRRLAAYKAWEKRRAA